MYTPTFQNTDRKLWFSTRSTRKRRTRGTEKHKHKLPENLAKIVKDTICDVVFILLFRLDSLDSKKKNKKQELSLRCRYWYFLRGAYFFIGDKLWKLEKLVNRKKMWMSRIFLNCMISYNTLTKKRILYIMNNIYTYNMIIINDHFMHIIILLVSVS